MWGFIINPDEYLGDHRPNPELVELLPLQAASRPLDPDFNGDHFCHAHLPVRGALPQLHREA